MGRGKSKQQKASRKREKKKALEASKDRTSTSWYGRVGFHLEETGANADVSKNSITPNSSLDLSIVSWNVLAETYCSQYSHPKLPSKFSSKVFAQKTRRKRLATCVRKLAESASILCLQEVDRPEIISTLEQELGYVGVTTPTSKNGSSGIRKDACTIHVDPKIWEIMGHEIVRFDDLAADTSDSSGDNNNPLSQHLQGIRQSFRRRNAGVIVRLRHETTTVVVVNAHLFWNPSFEYIKLCQAHYLLLRVQKFRLSMDEVVIVCGDMNSKPKGPTHTYFTSGVVNARAVAPWHIQPWSGDSDIDGEEIVDGNQERESEPQQIKRDDIIDSTHGVDTDSVVNGLSNLKICNSGETETQSEDSSRGRVRYLVDASLNKFCRWLRILGQDVALETEDEEIRRTKHNDMQIITRCKEEGRTLVTTSPKLMQRRDCPPSTYCITPTYLSTPKLEVALVHMLRTHGVVLEPDKFLSRCVVCNGSIVPATDQSHKRSILQEYAAPEDLLLDGPVYCCNSCNQGYWWNDRPHSSASRVKTHCTHLFELCIRGGIPSKGPLGMFDDVDVVNEKTKGWDDSLPGSELLQEPFPAVEWLRSEQLTIPFRLTSVYSDGNGGEDLPFTNVTAGFIDTLDYVLFSDTCELSRRLYVPRDFDELADGRDFHNAHLLPSDVWPSDHLAIGAILRVPTVQPLFCVPGEQFVQPGMNPRVSESHGVRCACGCVPKIPSMFEMAERRRVLREKQKNLVGARES